MIHPSQLDLDILEEEAWKRATEAARNTMTAGLKDKALTPEEQARLMASGVIKMPEKNHIVTDVELLKWMFAEPEWKDILLNVAPNEPHRIVYYLELCRKELEGIIDDENAREMFDLPPQGEDS